MDEDSKILKIYFSWLEGKDIDSSNFSKEFMEDLMIFAEKMLDKEFEFYLAYQSNVEPFIEILNIKNPFKKLDPSSYFAIDNTLSKEDNEKEVKRISYIRNKYYEKFLYEVYGDYETMNKGIGSILRSEINIKIRNIAHTARTIDKITEEEEHMILKFLESIGFDNLARTLIEMTSEDEFVQDLLKKAKEFDKEYKYNEMKDKLIYVAYSAYDVGKIPKWFYDKTLKYINDIPYDQMITIDDPKQFLQSIKKDIANYK